MSEHPSTYAVTPTGCDDLYVVFSRYNNGPAQLHCTANTYDAAKAIAAQQNLEQTIRLIALRIKQNNFTTDEGLASLCEAVQSLEQIVRWDMDGYTAQRRLQDAKKLAAGIVELEATA